MNSYRDYFVKTIEAMVVLRGLKLVLGGTGLGKTYGLREAIEEYVIRKPERKLKFIYITNRHNLITEQEKELKKAYNIPTAYLKSNKDIIQGLHEKYGLQKVIMELELFDYFQYDAELKYELPRKTKFRKLINSIDSKFNALKEEQQLLIQGTIEKELSHDYNELFNIFKKQLTLIHRHDKNQYEELITERMVWNLFPYVEFENNPKCNVLLATIHKMQRGFFNGKTTNKLAAIKNKIIFFDEFDFLESDILKILCDEPSIMNPLEFVSIFHEGFKHWSKANFWNSSNQLKEVNNKFSDVIEYIDKSCKKYNINLSSVIDFRLSDENKDESPNVIFQTNQMITLTPFFLRESNNSWFIESTPPKDSINPRMLFNILTNATRKIIGVFNYFKFIPGLADDVIQKLWNPKNDNQGGIYENYIKENLLYHREAQKAEQGLTINKDGYEIGYRLIKLFKRTISFDPNSAELSQIELFTTPERLIAKLSDTNLVFGLSATADLPRNLKCFNLKWLRKNTNYIELDESDYALIEKLRNEKANIRDTSVNLQLAKTLKEDSEIQKRLQALSVVGFFKNDDSQSFRLDRVSKVFNTIQSILNSDKFSHLIFLTTFNELKKIFNNEDVVSEIFQNTNKLGFEVMQTSNGSDKYFHLKWNNKSCNLVFLSAEDARKLEESKAALQNYQTAFKADKIIVITQYNSASNGVNLPCYDELGRETDFRGLHLLEENHFWFDDEEVDLYKMRIIEKQAFWYLWKLWDDRQIDRTNFKVLLSKRDTGNIYKPHIKAFNSVYKKTSDKILNAISLYHQAIGRIERKKENIPVIDITLDEGVFLEFYKYMTTEEFQELMKERDNKITSALILEIQKQVLKLADEKNIKAAFSKPKSLKPENDRSEELIGKLLVEIERVKKNQCNKVYALNIRESWNKIREVVLKHDFNARFDVDGIIDTIDVERDLCFETKYVSGDKEILIDNHDFKIYKEVPLKDLYHWKLDYVYLQINKNQVIKSFFEREGYKTAFETSSTGFKTFFTPYIHQAILQGAIGEKAIKALLEYSGIQLENEKDLPNNLFEVIDAKIKGIPIYLDFKNYSNSTLNKFFINEGDFGYEFKFDSKNFIKKLVEKYQTITCLQANAILYVVNLYSEDDRSPDYFDADGNRQNDINKSCIRIIPSVLTAGDENKVNAHFELLTQEIVSEYEKK